jgi:hypothetical protein
MRIEPSFVTVGNLFGQKAIYKVPKYQRAYAWEEESVEDFLEDTQKCYDARKNGQKLDHFFGGILCVQHKVAGTLNQYEYELIDGQQRTTTYTILVRVLIDIYESLLDKLDDSNKEIILTRINDLTERYIQFSHEINRKIQKVDVLTLSRADKDFYRTLVNGLNPENPERESHKRLKNAYLKMYKFISSLIDDDNVLNKVDNIEILGQIMDNDFSILHMVTEKKEDAYRLFQVINDRGVSLTDGDLLRAKTLELLEGSSNEQDAVENIWNNILKEHPNTTADYLTWIYESNVGRRPKKSELYDKFLEQFFPVSLNSTSLYNAVQQVESDINMCRKLTRVEWLFEHQRPIVSWDRNRLSLLIDTLGHKLAYPLLLSATQLNHKQFAEIVHILEKVFFRYKIICDGHVTPLKNLYYEEAVNIRSNPTTYNVTSLKDKLNILMETKADNDTFTFHLRALKYIHNDSSNNRKLRYFLLTLEYYYNCYSNNNVWTDSCIDKSRVYDFVDTSIEHIYPRNASGSNIEIKLEDLKNKLGNLCIMDPVQNTISDDKPFNEKKSIYNQTSVKMLNEIATKTSWDENEIKSAEDNMIKMALKIFRA